MPHMIARDAWLLLYVSVCTAAVVPIDTTGVRPGPVTVTATGESVTVAWPDETGSQWRAEFSLDPVRPLITGIGVAGKLVVERARPMYWVETGKRRGGWDAFFDNPTTHPEGTRRFTGVLKLTSAKARTLGDRVELLFDGLTMGPFRGGVAYTFFPGSRLIQQEAVASTGEPDTAYFYDAGIRMANDRDRKPGWDMDSQVVFYDTSGKLRTEAPELHRKAVATRYRAIAARLERGSVAVFPTPHQYYFARDITTNLAHTWHSSYRGDIFLGVRQISDDNTPFYPWMNAPPGTSQRMTLFLLPSGGDAGATLDQTLRYTNSDRYPKLDGYKTFAPHWHFAYTMQALKNGFDWTPPFKTVLKAMGVNAAAIMDFHGDGHPADTTDLRLEELAAFFKACRSQSDSEFLLLPSEEANVHLGGHWSLFFPKPVNWFMKRGPNEEPRGSHPAYGPYYRIGNEAELLQMVRAEGGYMYQTHPRTKGSTGFPDKIRETEHFKDRRYLGAGWKAMPSDLSTGRAGLRSLKLLDDMNNWGLKKRIFGEVDVFQLDSTHELYAHMNINYVKLASQPAWDDYGKYLEGLARGEYFTTTGEILLPSVSIAASPSGGIVARADVRWTYPLKFAEIVWGDGTNTHTEVIPLESTREFGTRTFDWNVEAPGWRWARVAVWDVAANGAFVNPTWR